MKSNRYVILALGALLTMTPALFGMAGSVARYYQKGGPILGPAEDGDFAEARQALEAYKADPRTMTRDRRRRIGKHAQIIRQLQLYLNRAERAELAERRRLLEELPFQHAEIEDAEARGAARAARAARKKAAELMRELPFAVHEDPEMALARREAAEAARRRGARIVEREAMERIGAEEAAYEGVRGLFGDLEEVAEAAEDVARAEEREADVAGEMSEEEAAQEARRRSTFAKTTREQVILLSRAGKLFGAGYARDIMREKIRAAREEGAWEALERVIERGEKGLPPLEEEEEELGPPPPLIDEDDETREFARAARSQLIAMVQSRTLSFGNNMLAQRHANHLRQWLAEDNLAAIRKNQEPIEAFLGEHSSE